MFYKSLSCIVYTLAAQYASKLGLSLTIQEKNRTVQFVTDQHRQMPEVFKLGICVLTLFLCLHSLRLGGLLYRIAPKSRLEALESWRTGPLSFQRDLMKYYDSLVLLFVMQLKQGES